MPRPDIHGQTAIQNAATAEFGHDSFVRLRKQLKESTGMTEWSTTPDYRALFDEAKACDHVEHDQSILSPGAYFVDLMRLINTKITSPVAQERTLLHRRPDLMDIALDGKSTNDEVPYLEIVNKIMSDRLATLSQNRSEQALNEAIYPFNLPCDTSLDRIRSYTAANGIALSSIYESLNAKPHRLAEAVLGISNAMWTLISTPDISLERLSEAYGLPQATGDQSNDDRQKQITAYVAALQTSENFCSLAGLTEKELEELLQNAGYGPDVRPSDDPSPSLESKFLTRYLEEKLAAIDPDLTGQRRKAIMMVYEGKIDVRIWYGETQYYAERQYSERDRERTGAREYATWTEPNSQGWRILWDVLHRFIRLARKLDWSFTELDQALLSIGAEEIDDKALIALAEIKKLEDRFSVPVNQLFCFWQDLSAVQIGAIFGIDSADASQITIPTEYVNPEEAYRFAIPAWLSRVFDNETSEFLWIYTLPLQEGLLEIVPTFNERATDNQLDVTDTTRIPLSPQNLSAFYRIKRFADLIGWPVRQAALFLFTTESGVNGPADLNQALSWLDFLSTSGLTSEQLSYMAEGAKQPKDAPYTVSAARTMLEALTKKVMGQPREEQISLLIGGLADFYTLDASDLYAIILSLVDNDAKKLNRYLNDLSAYRFSTRLDPAEQLTEGPVPSELADAFKIRGIDLPEGTTVTQRDQGDWIIQLRDAKGRFSRSYLINLFVRPGEAGSQEDNQHGVEVYENTSELKTVVRLTERLATWAEAVYAAKALGLAGPDFDAITANTKWFGLTKTSSWKTASGLRAMHTYKALQAAFDGEPLDLADLIPSEEDAITAITPSDENLWESYVALESDYADQQSIKTVAITGWPRPDVYDWFYNDGSAAYKSHKQAVSSVEAMSRLHAQMGFAMRLGVGPSSIGRYLPDAGDYVPDYFADDLLQAVKAKHGKKKWSDVQAKTGKHVLERQRDVLAGRLKFLLNFDSNQALSDHLLVDVQMGGVTTISKVKLGINTLQHYIQRCNMGLEDNGEDGGKVRVPLSHKEWSWRSHYRVWEANRKVFFHPENNLDPDLRIHKTPEFTELQAQLLENEITPASVAEAYNDYFDKVENLARLKIVSSYMASVAVPEEDRVEKTLYLIGRSHTTNPVFFHRKAIIADSEQDGDAPQILRWSPWQQVDLPINAPTVNAIHIFGKLFLFWVERLEEKRTVTVDNHSAHTTVTKATIKYTFQTISGEWVSPQIVKSLKNLKISEDVKQLDFEINKYHKKSIEIFNKLKQDISDVQITEFVDKSSVYWYDVPSSSINIMDCFDLDSFSNYAREASQPNFNKAERRARLRQKLIAEGWRRFRAAAYHQVDGNRVFQVEGADGLQSAKPLDMEGLIDAKMGDSIATLDAAAEEFLAALKEQDSWVAARQQHGIYDTTQAAQWDYVSVFLADVPKPSSNERQILVAYGDHNAYQSDGSNTRKKSLTFLPALMDADLVDRQADIHLAIDGRPLRKSAIDPDIAKGFYWGVVRSQSVPNRLLHGRIESFSHPKDVYFGDLNGHIYYNITTDNFFGGRTETRSYWYPNRKEYVADVMKLVDRNTNNFRHDGRFAAWCEQTDFDAVAASRLLKCDAPGFDVLQVANQPGWACVSTGDEQFLVIPKGAQAGTLAEGLSAEAKPDGQLSMLYDDPSVKPDGYKFVRLASTAIDDLSQKMFAGGVDHLLTEDSQQTAEEPFSRLSPSVERLEPPTSDQLDFDGAFGLYFKEIFFHIPFLIANRLNASRHFEEARKWYHHIFNPLPYANDGKTDDEMPYWRYLPFRGHSLELLSDIGKASPEEMRIYEDDPFDPHAIAGIRPGAYEKAIVMRYIDNLLDWGDQLFANDNWESIVQAHLLYTQAQNMLGKKPAQNSKPYDQSERTYEMIVDYNIDASELAKPFCIEDISFFPLMPNSVFSDYWSRVEDRLSKIRHSMDIKGNVRHLELFQPEIDPAALIRAMAAGQDIDSIASGFHTPVPHYRFSTMIRRAREAASTVARLGSTLSNTLERKDAEQLSVMRSTHEKATLQQLGEIKVQQIDDAEAQVEALEASLQNAKDRRTYYGRLLSKGLNASEKNAQKQMNKSLKASYAAIGVRAGAVPAHMIPTIGGTSEGGFQPGSSVSEAASLSDGVGAMMAHRAGMAQTDAQNHRRKEEWELQRNLADHDCDQISAQLEGAKLRLEIATKTVKSHESKKRYAEEQDILLKGKFTNGQLYQVLAQRLARIHQESYQVAYDLAKLAEKAYQYERSTGETKIGYDYWSSGQHGLLAGDSLMLSLDQLEAAYEQENEREFEIEKTISLNALTSDELHKLKTTGSCTFTLNEELFDRDFPGHYRRRIKSLAVTIPAIVGPYQNVRATLTQTLNRIILAPDSAAVDFLLPEAAGERGAGSDRNIRTDWRKRQKIALSKGVDDSGLFELNFRDERYLPFEGTGAVSEWKLDMPLDNNSIDFKSISDVIIRLRYTALEHDGLETHVRTKLEGLDKGALGVASI